MLRIMTEHGPGAISKLGVNAGKEAIIAAMSIVVIMRAFLGFTLLTSTLVNRSTQQKFNFFTSLYDTHNSFIGIDKPPTIVVVGVIMPKGVAVSCNVCLISSKDKS